MAHRPNKKICTGRIDPRLTFVCLLFLVSVLFFARSYTSYFVSDDYEFLGRISFGTAGQYFSRSWGYGNEYRPLVAYSYALDAAISGLSPIGYHFTNTILHIGTSLLVAATAVECGLPFSYAALASVLFLLNPVAHESVLWIAGRPVVLSTFFVGVGLWAFVKAAKAPSRSTHSWVISHFAFAAALLTYEGSVGFPLLAFLLWIACVRTRSRLVLQNLTAYFITLLAYAAAWNVFFHFTITRFPVESSVLTGSCTLAVAVLHAFHGASRTLPAILYLGPLIVLCLRAPGRKIAIFCAAWFGFAYLPFFIVHGFADRFAYASSASVAVVLSGAVWAVYQRSRQIGIAVLFGLVCYYAVGMQNRISIWQQAGMLARRIVLDIKAVEPELPGGTTLVLLDVPDMYKHALVFMTGLERAVRLQYPGSAIFSVRREIPSTCTDPLIVFQYVRGHMAEVRKTDDKNVARSRSH
jgi:hypothetical protein